MIGGSKAQRMGLAAILVLLSLAIILTLYQAAVPERYDLSVGDPVPDDIVSTRAIVDSVQTERRALEQASQVQDVMVRSDSISQLSLQNLDAFIQLAREHREILYVAPVTETSQTVPDATGTNETGPSEPQTTSRRLVPTPATIRAQADELVADALAEFSVELIPTDVESILTLNDSVFNAFSNHMTTIARVIMTGSHDPVSLLITITSRVNEVVASSEFYQNELSLISTFLRQFLQPNLVFDQNATQAARDAVVAQVRQNPVYIPQGTLIASAGEELSEVQYDNLVRLDLVNTGAVNWRTLVSILSLFLLIVVMLWIYFRYYEKRQLRSAKDWVIATVSVAFIIFVSAYLSNISPLLIPVYFIAIVLSTYFGLRTSLVLTSMLILLLYPITSLNSHFLFVGIMGSWAAALIAASQSKTRNYAMIIIGTTLVCFSSSVIYSTMTQVSTGAMLQSTGLVTLTGALSAVLAIGLSPIFELLLSSISPVKLISLAEPSQPLLRKLFLEAPGTYQHSMMIANLAEAAAERIGADALLVRVGAYYHDLGKTMNPLMFTENQKGFNPHSLLTTEESVRIIFRHVKYGEELGKRHRLPREVINFMTTHHGTTVLSYFYNQATKEAEAKGLPKPDPKDFSYPGEIPMNKETGIFMLADTTEAAVRSAGTSHIEEAEKFIRKLIRAKMDQDQLINSGLSFHEVEEIIQAFLQVYAGQFHERIKYPDANPVSEPAN